MARLTYSAEFTSVLFLLIVLYGLIFEVKNRTKAVNVFTGLVIGCIAFTLIDAISWVIDGKPELNTLNKILSTISFLGTPFLILAFNIYAKTFVDAKNEKKNNHFIIAISIIIALEAIFVLVAGFGGWLFTFDQFGHYKVNDIYIIDIVFSYICFVATFIFLFRHIKNIGIKNFRFFLMFLFFPLIFLIVESFFEDISLVYVGGCVSVFVMFFFIQTNVIAESRLKQKIIEEVAYVDALTGLKNRYKFEETMNSISKNDSYAIYFTDVNKLKYTNDTLGHDFGDVLIIQCANAVADNFGSENVYRISGDEFIAVIKDISKEEFEEKLESFRTKLKENQNLACCGGYYGKNLEPFEAFRKAELNLNKAKTSYYKESGVERRK